METPAPNKRVIFYGIISLLVIIGLWKDFGSLITQSIGSGDPVQYLAGAEDPVNGSYKFNSPGGITINENGDIYVIDIVQYEHRTILRFDSSWKFLSQFSKDSHGGLPTSMEPPLAITHDTQSNIYTIIDTVHGMQVRKFDASGKTLMKFGRKGGNNGEFQTPSDIAVDSQGNIYVSDSNNRNIQKFNPSGKILMKILAQGHKLAIDPQDNLYVADREKARVQKFDSSGKLLAQFNIQGGDMTVGKDGNLYVVDTNKNSIKKITNSGILLSELSTAGKGITGIALDNTGNIYATDNINGRIQKFVQSSEAHLDIDISLPITDKDIPIVEKFEAIPLQPATELKLISQFSIGSGAPMTVDPDGNIYNLLNNRVRKFDTSGKLLMEFNNQGLMARDIMVDGLGNIYLILSGEDDHDKVQKFDPSGKLLIDFGNTDLFDRTLRVSQISLDTNGNIYVATLIGILKFNSSGNLLNNFGTIDRPIGIAIDSTGNIYYSGQDDRIRKIDSSGKLVMSFVPEGIDDGEYISPGRLAINAQGDLYIHDYVYGETYSIKKYSSSGKYISQFDNKSNFSIDKSGNIYTIDSGRVQKFVEIKKE